MANILKERIARYEDSQQIHSTDFSRFPPKVTMKKMSHNLFIEIDGPEDLTQKAKDCFNSAIQDGLMATVAAAFLGAGLSAAEVGFAVVKARMMECIGGSVTIKLMSDDEWIYWDL